MLQAIKQIGIDLCAFYTTNKTDIDEDLYNWLHKSVASGRQCIFIDEITLLPYVLFSLNRLSDVYAMQGVHIVVAGTDSYALELVSRNTLYDRCVFIRTTNISYKEYCYLRGDVSVDEYLQSGGCSACYILITADIEFTELRNILENQAITRCDYVCIDEVTRCNGFSDKAAWLSDFYCVNNTLRLILTGTDSFCFFASKKGFTFWKGY
jgi:predicted AAA+ superfamily ATPase